MIDDPRVSWKLANPYGIVIEETKEQWWAGRVFDVLEIENGNSGILVATETGGVWLIDNSNHAIALSNSWEFPSTNCLLSGPFGARHFFAGASNGAIYETNYRSKTPLLDWFLIEDPLPASAGAVNSLELFQYAGVLVAACEGGLYWSKIPELAPWWCISPKLGFQFTFKTRYKWTKVNDPPSSGGGYWSLARAYHSRQEKLLVGAMNGGLYVGRWENGGISLHRPILNYLGGNWADIMFDKATGNTSVAVCEGFPLNAYAVCAKGDGRMHMAIRSRDAGENWTFVDYGIRQGVNVQGDIRLAAGDQGARLGANNCIAVHPSAPGVAAIGWQFGTFITPQGGSDWIHVSDQVHHADIHCLLFRKTTPAFGHELLIGGDGGLALVPVDKVFGFDSYEAKSDYNRNLANIQHYAANVGWRQFYGSLSASQDGDSLVASGVHDNGNIFAHLSDPVTPWKKINGGDGGWTAVISGAQVVVNVMGTEAVQANIAGGSVASTSPIPIDQPVVAAPGLMSPIGDAVRRPGFTDAAGRPMVACGGGFGSNGSVFGLFRNSDGQSHQWKLLGNVGQGLVVSAVGSYDGSTIVVGASSRLFFLNSATGQIRELPVILPKPSSNVQQAGGSIDRICMISDGAGFAMLNGTSLGNNYILEIDGRACTAPLSNGLPLNEGFYGLDAHVVRSNHWVLFTSTESNVYLSEDLGFGWTRASLNLPRKAYCGDLRVGEVDGRPHILLGTFGRSLWKADLGRFI